ncbi:MAG TPA: class I SAM-dependent methyltransferase [Frankiaceae bacterium]|nr:class I SAM-dependent methyltransferase [Frankiaceae bacterium]
MPHAAVLTSDTRARLPVLELYERGLATHRLWAREHDGARFGLPVADWSQTAIPGDTTLLERCSGATLDIGCGPGRLAAALSTAGVDALGIDISAGAVARARKLGANALRRCVFGPVPRAGTWRCALLADGNIGIGGEPTLLLRRVRQLLAPGGRVLVEIAPPDVATTVRELWLEDESGARSEPFAWAEVGADDVTRLARECELKVTATWTASRRWFAELRRD